MALGSLMWFGACVREELLGNMEQVPLALPACQKPDNFIAKGTPCQVDHQHFSLFFRREMHDLILISRVCQSPPKE